MREGKEMFVTRGKKRKEWSMCKGYCKNGRWQMKRKECDMSEREESVEHGRWKRMNET